MHSRYGKDTNHICKECKNLLWHIYGNTSVHKCKVYGVSMSCATDFPVRQFACGLFNKDAVEKNIYKTLNRKQKTEEQSETLF